MKIEKRELFKDGDPTSVWSIVFLVGMLACSFAAILAFLSFVTWDMNAREFGIISRLFMVGVVLVTVSAVKSLSFD